MFKGTIRGDNELKEFGLKYISSEAPESMIQVLELITEKMN